MICRGKQMRANVFSKAGASGPTRQPAVFAPRTRVQNVDSVNAEKRVPFYFYFFKKKFSSKSLKNKFLFHQWKKQNKTRGGADELFFPKPSRVSSAVHSKPVAAVFYFNSSCCYAQVVFKKQTLEERGKAEGLRETKCRYVLMSERKSHEMDQKPGQNGKTKLYFCKREVYCKKVLKNMYIWIHPAQDGMDNSSNSQNSYWLVLICWLTKCFKTRLASYRCFNTDAKFHCFHD